MGLDKVELEIRHAVYYSVMDIRLPGHARGAGGILFLGLALLLAALTACSAESTNGAPDFTLRPSQPTVLPAVLPSPTPPPPAPSVLVNGQLAQQGGFFFVRLVDPPPQTAQPVVSFAGSSYQMQAEQGGWSAFIGLPVDTTPGGYAIEVTANGLTIAAGSVDVTATNFPVEYLDLPPDPSALLVDTAAIQAELELLASIYGDSSGSRAWNGQWLAPVSGAITNSFGSSRSINGGPLTPHTGTDIAADEGSLVVAAANGRVVFAGELYLRGNSVVIDHGAGVFSGYHHLSAIAVSVGRQITMGDLVGLVGETGLADGPHLHWEAIVQGVRVDATLWTRMALEP